MLCAHRLSAAPAQPNQRLSRRLASAMALRSTRARGRRCARGRRRRPWPGRGRWRRSACRRARGACRRTAAGRARWPPELPETRLLGSGVRRGGQGPCARMAARSRVAEGRRRLVSGLCTASAPRRQSPAPGKAGDGGERALMAPGSTSCVRRVRLSPWNEVERQPPHAGHVQHQAGDVEAAGARLR